MATVLLMALMNKAAAMLSRNWNSCHASYLEIFKILSKVAHASECDIVFGQYHNLKELKFLHVFACSWQVWKFFSFYSTITVKFLEGFQKLGKDINASYSNSVQTHLACNCGRSLVARIYRKSFSTFIITLDWIWEQF